MSAPLTLAAAVAAVTERVHISISAALVTLHDPVRFAEQLTPIDLLAPGRMSVILGTGYRQAEFDMVGLDFKDRWKVFDENVARDPRGDHRPAVRVPGTQGGGDPGVDEPAVPAAHDGRQHARPRRAGPPDSDSASSPPPPTASCADYYAGRVPEGRLRVRLLQRARPTRVHPRQQRSRARLGADRVRTPCTRRRCTGAGSGQGQHSAVTVDDATSVEGLKASGVYRVLTPDECVEMWNEMGDADTFLLHPLMGGIPPELAWESLHLFESDVLPRVRPSA